MKNGKFEVGDIVAGKKNPRIQYGLTNYKICAHGGSALLYRQ